MDRFQSRLFSLWNCATFGAAIGRGAEIVAALLAQSSLPPLKLDVFGLPATSDFSKSHDERIDNDAEDQLEQ